jgi:eukaryotic-like serine/threonine-protein kinase
VSARDEAKPRVQVFFPFSPPQGDLSFSHQRIGDVQRAQGDLSAALTSYQVLLAIAERLAEADPGNAWWQRDLALSYGRVAIVEAQQGARENALGALR